MNMQLTQVLFGALVLSLVHVPMPNHWVPVVMVSKIENWTRGESLVATALIGIPHTVSTILAGAVFGLLGYEFSSTSDLIMRFSAPAILVALGLIYLFLDFKDPGQPQHQVIKTEMRSKKSKFALISSLGIALFLSPCIAIGVYCFTAGVFGWIGISAVLTIYVAVTIPGMVLMVNYGLKGVEKVKSGFLGRHGRSATGIVLIVLGVFGYFIL